MKLRFLAPLAALAAFTPAASQAEPGFADGHLNVYAGPGHRYPELTALHDRTRVEIHGCLADYKWCDVSVGRFRGWVDGDDLLVRRRGHMYEVQDEGARLGVPVIGFIFDDYWGRNYSRSAFYDDRGRWRDMDHDGIPNRMDRDRDGDGVPNRFDDAPNNRRAH